MRPNVTNKASHRRALRAVHYPVREMNRALCPKTASTVDRLVSHRNSGSTGPSSPGRIQPVRSFPNLDCLVLPLLSQQSKCPVYRFVQHTRFDDFASIDPVPLIQEIAAVNAHSGPPRETLGCASLGSDDIAAGKKRPLAPVDIGDNCPVAARAF
jgi:hypothetical protein